LLDWTIDPFSSTFTFKKNTSSSNEGCICCPFPLVGCCHR
jgi:hypothetical protein